VGDPVLTSFFLGKGDRITPVPPWNETGGQTKIASGVSVPRALVANVGTWSVTLVEEGLDIASLETLSLWASSDFGATNVRFSIIVGLNGNQIATLSTDTKATLSTTPTEFTLSASSSNFPPRFISKGSQLSFQIQYSSSSPRGVGPSVDSTVYYYHDIYRSRIDFMTNPFNLTITEARLDIENVNVTAIVKDAFGVPTEEREIAVLFSGPSASQGEFVTLVSTVYDRVNGTTMTWNWDFKSQGPVSSGLYTVTLSARYAGSELNYTTSNTTNLKFPKVEEGGVLPGLEAAGAVAALGVVALAAAARNGPDQGPAGRGRRR
jgi:hypothetical protein